MSITARAPSQGSTPGQAGAAPALKRPPEAHPIGPLGHALRDLAEGVRRWRVGAWLGWRDVFLPLRRTFVGPAWITLQAIVWVTVIVVLLGPALSGGDPRYPVYAAVGVVFFQFMTTMIVDGAGTFLKDKGLIQNIPNPLSIYLFRVLFKGLILLGLQLPVIIGAMLVARLSPTIASLYAVPGLLLVLLALTGVQLFLASLTPLYRDIPFGLTAVMRVMFFATPVFWLVELRGGPRAILSAWNPLAHFLNMVREPLLGAAPSVLSITVTAGIAVLGWGLGLWVFSRTRPLVASNL